MDLARTHLWSWYHRVRGFPNDSQSSPIHSRSVNGSAPARAGPSSHGEPDLHLAVSTQCCAGQRWLWNGLPDCIPRFQPPRRCPPRAVFAQAVGRNQTCAWRCSSPVNLTSPAVCGTSPRDLWRPASTTARTPSQPITQTQYYYCLLSIITLQTACKEYIKLLLCLQQII